MPARRQKSLLTSFRNGISTSIRNNSAAYGYSIVVTASFATLSHFNGPPDLSEIYVFIGSAVAAFASLQAAATRFFTERLPGEPTTVVALGSAFSIVSISTAVAVTALTARFMSGWGAWAVSAFFATAIYLILVAVEMMLAERIEENVQQ